MKLKTALAIILVPCLIAAGGAAFWLPHPAGQANPDGKAPATTQDQSALPQTPTTPPSQPAGPQEPDTNQTAIPEPGDLGGLIKASNRFALDMYSELANGQDNLFFSPYSIFTALGMTYEGAVGKTAEELRSVFNYPADNETRWALFKALIDTINMGDGKSNLSTANALWVQYGYPLYESFLNATTKYYDANVSNVDTGGDPEGARAIINGWVENRTNGKIKDLLPKGSIDNARLILTNAIYFKANWLLAFNRTKTREMAFHTGPNSTVQASMMVRNDEKSRYNYTKTDGLQLLEMLYAGEKYSMLVLLPGDNEMGTSETSLTLEKLREWKQNMTEQRVDVLFPKFRFDTVYQLNGNLSDMGMPSAFSPGGFSGIGPLASSLYISGIFHKAFVAVDEEGTEAAAATAVSFKDCVEPAVPSFNADHPFIFLIQERETGNILFMGKVLDPTK